MKPNAKQNDAKIRQFENDRDVWIDSLLNENVPPFVMKLTGKLQARMAQDRMTLPYRLLHVIIGLFYRLSIDEAQHADMAVAGKKGFRSSRPYIKSITLTVKLNRKEIGKKDFPLGIYI